MRSEEKREYWVSVSIVGEVSYNLKSRWSAKETMENIHKFAKRDAIAKINEKLGGNGRVQGDPVVNIAVREVLSP